MCIFIGEHIITREFLGLSLLPVVDDTPEQREEDRGTDVEDGDSQEKGITHTSAALIKYWKVEESRNLRGERERGGGTEERGGSGKGRKEEKKSERERKVSGRGKEKRRSGGGGIRRELNITFTPLKQMSCTVLTRNYKQGEGL